MFGWIIRLAAKPLIASVLGRVKAAWDWVFKSTAHVLLALLALMFGLLLWQHFKLNRALDDKVQLESKLEDCRLGRAADIKTWTERVAAAEELAKQRQLALHGASQDAQAYHDQLVAADKSLRDYKSTHRLRGPGTAQAGTLPPAPAGDGGGAQVHGDTSASTLLAITSSDIDACDASYSYAASAYYLMQDLISRGLAVQQ